MLISQRIAKEPNFLQSVTATGLKPASINKRIEITRCVKIIVPNEMINFNGKLPPLFLDMLKKGHKEYMKHCNMYIQYARLPYPNMLFENESGAAHVTEIPGGCKINVIHTTGQILDVTMELYLGGADVPRLVIERNSYIKNERTNEEDIGCQLFVSQLCEVLLFMTAVNLKMHTYSLSKKEMKGIPQNSLPFYTYKILDIFREKKEYISLKDVEDTLAVNSKHAVVRRGHMVKGHWKAKKNGLFWWSSFMRCKKNIKDVGIIEKDYNLVLS